MAKSSKGKNKTSKIDETADDAVEVVNEGSVTSDAEQVDDAEQVTDEGAASEDDPALDMEIVDDPVENDPAEDKDPADETVEEPAANPLPEPVPEPVTVRSGPGFVPLAFGGIVAGLIGYGVATYYPLTAGDDDLSAQLAAQAVRIAALEAALADQPEPDLSAVQAEIAEVGAQTGERIDGLATTLEEQFESLDARLLEVEKRPSGDGTLSDTALAAYQRELEELRTELDAQKEDVMSAAAAAEADLAAAREEAERLEQEAIAAAEAAATRAALNRVATAVETGAPFVDALADLGVEDIPAKLTDAADEGVATNSELAADFPIAARAALATARAEGVSDDAGGIGGFFRSQFDVRSTTPQEGDGPDAVLSRAEAAVKDGRVADALAELEALPEVARAELTDWTARAQARSDVLDAIATLSETQN